MITLLNFLQRVDSYSLISPLFIKSKFMHASIARLATHLLMLMLLVLSTYAHALPTQEIALDPEAKNWQSLNYRNIPANTFSLDDSSLKIEVNASAGPLIYVFDRPVMMQQIFAQGQLGQLPSLPPGLIQGEKGADDFVLRIGLVLAGDKTLNFAQRLIAAPWVNTLFSLAPSDEGVDHVQFLNLANPGSRPWKSRQHPDGKGLFQEIVVGDAKANKTFQLNYQLPEARRVLALWISSDGDDTDSSFELHINRIAYQ